MYLFDMGLTHEDYNNVGNYGIALFCYKRHLNGKFTCEDKNNIDLFIPYHSKGWKNCHLFRKQH